MQDNIGKLKESLNLDLTKLTTQQANLEKQQSNLEKQLSSTTDQLTTARGALMGIEALERLNAQLAAPHAPAAPHETAVASKAPAAPTAISGKPAGEVKA